MSMRRSRLISLVATTIALFVGCKASTAGDTAGIVLTASPTRIALGRDLPAVDVWSYGGRVPGPFLRVPHGGRVRVRIDNRLPVATTVHWHGVRVPNAMDGVPGVTQPAIEPGTSFTYEFVAPDPGTYWFHSHASGSEQVERGLQGVLIVEDHPDTARVISRMLSASGHTVKTAHSAASALELAATEPFEVIVSDIGLPDATGYELMKQLKSR